MKRKIGSFRILFVCTFSLWFNLRLNAQETDSTQNQEIEQISTWKFANNIGWRGVEWNFGFMQPLKNQRYDNSVLWKSSDEVNSSSIEAEVDSMDYDYLSTLYAQRVTLNAIFLPFRNSKNRLFRKAEWHCGLDFQSESLIIPYFNKIEKNSITQYKTISYYQFDNKTLYFSNSLIFESKSFLSRLKIFGGPGLNFSLIPDKSISRHSPDFVKTLEIDRGKFAFQTNLVAGLKVSLGCRFNLQMAYLLSQNNWVMNRSFDSKTYGGFQIGLRYKFMKPAKREINMDAPFW